MMSVCIRTIVAAGLITLLGATTVAANNLPEYYPDHYEAIGPLVGINSQDGYVVILDFQYPYNSATRVNTPATRFETTAYLRPGMLVGISREDRHSPVTDIWVLPDGYQLEEASP